MEQKNLDCFELINKASQKFSFKIAMMGYYNTVYKYSEDKFCQKLQQVGACSLIIPDLPLEESQVLQTNCNTCDLAFIRLITPTSSQERIKTLVQNATGFVYAVARTGVTGSKTDFSKQIDSYLHMIRSYTDLPIGLGFGISDASDIALLKGKVDMAIMGTVILNKYLEDNKEGVYRFLMSCRD